MTTKTSISLLTIVLSLATVSLLVSLSTTNFAFATTGHTCDSPHCYAIVHAKWQVWPFSGLREESGNKGTNVLPSTLPTTSGTNHWVANPFWVIFPDADFVEVGWIKGNGICGTHSTSQWYWVKWENNIPSHGCISSPTSNATYELSDTDKNKTWSLKIAGTQRTTSAQDYSKGWLDVGSEYSVNTISHDGKSQSLQYYDTQWRNWDYASTTGTGQYSVDWCTEPTSFEHGDAPLC